ncbi:Cytochrome C and Quinol oxidase polypeptide I [Paenimyroides aquimaris]|uniref:Cytochrome C and Quinol oxidase polypeptide I n=1 Tax=Paenimyroides marinum TaxID=1159016 RepID=A0A1H6KZ49_9FLAO|nr:Cytochrome C and Quinol oxidase polypeptide I [Paenimyroides aquimaris]
MNIKTPYLFFIGFICYFLISVIFSADLNSTIDINVHDTYFVISNVHLLITISIFVLFQGLLYLIIEKLNLKLYSLLIKLHFLFVVIFLSILLFLLNFESNYANLMWFNIGIVIAFLGSILIPTINLLFSVLNRKKI